MKRSPIVRKTPLKAKQAPTRRAWINRTTKGAKRKGRKPSETLRIYGPPERRAFVRALPCLVCGVTSFGASQNCHIVTGGTGRKADADQIVPLCSPHHESLHKRGRDEFETRYGVNLIHEAARVEAAWQAHTLSRTTV